MKPHRIGWPADEPLMIASSREGDVRIWFTVEEPMAGEHLAGFPFWKWHGALTDALHWGYTPEADPPRGWVRIEPARKQAA